MDKEQAKFILESFRADGADAHDETFTEALQLAVENRELGEWLANERSTDAEFASALEGVEIPSELRLHILSVMRGESINDPEAELEMDGMFMAALDDMPAPEGLRDQILAAMEVQQHESEAGVIPINSESEKKGGWINIKSIMSVAAALVLGGFLALQTGVISTDDRMTARKIQLHAGEVIKIGFNLDVNNSDKDEVNYWLVSHQLPVASNLPEGLDAIKLEGCKELILPGETKASLLCLTEGSGGTVHVVIVKKGVVKDDNMPFINSVSRDNCYFCPRTGYDIAHWQDDENTYIMMAKPQKSEKNTLARYF